MNIGLMIIVGLLFGLVVYNLKGLSSGFGLWWDMFLGAVGFTVANSVLTMGYVLSIFSKKDVIHTNLESLVVGIAGAIVSLYLSRFYNKAFNLYNFQLKH